MRGGGDVSREGGTSAALAPPGGQEKKLGSYHGNKGPRSREGGTWPQGVNGWRSSHRGLLGAWGCFAEGRRKELWWQRTLWVLKVQVASVQPPGGW